MSWMCHLEQLVFTCSGILEVRKSIFAFKMNIQERLIEINTLQEIVLDSRYRNKEIYSMKEICNVESETRTTYLTLIGISDPTKWADRYRKPTLITCSRVGNTVMQSLKNSVGLNKNHKKIISERKLAFLMKTMWNDRLCKKCLWNVPSARL